MLEMDGVTKVFPVAKDAPPVEDAYQLVVEPAGGQILLTPKFTVPVLQRDPSIAENTGVVISTE